MSFYKRFVLILMLVLVSCNRNTVTEEEEATETEELPGFVISVLCSPELELFGEYPRGMIHRLEMPQTLDSQARAGILGRIADSAAIIVVPAPTGTASLFEEIKHKYPDILRLAIQPEENVLALEAEADLIIDLDLPVMLWSSFRLARDSAVTKLVEINSPESVKTRRNAYLNALADRISAEMGIELSRLNPEELPEGENLALFSTDPAISNEILEFTIENGLLYLELGAPSGNYGNGKWAPDTYIDDIMRMAGSRLRAGKILVWPWMRKEVMLACLIEQLNAVLRGEVRLRDSLAFQNAAERVFPLVSWETTWRMDPESLVRAGNHLLIRNNPFLLGRSYVSGLWNDMPLGIRSIVFE